MNATPAVRCDNASVDIGGTTVVRDLDVTVERGRFVAVLGPNGAGKTTLLKAMLGFIPVSHGALTVLGRAPGHANAEIGYLPQRRSFDPGLRVRGIDVVRLGLDGHRWGLPLPFANRFGRTRPSPAAIVDDAVEVVGASAYAHRPIGEVSGGEQQRLLIAQALVRRPSLLLLDEPLDSLDLPNQIAVSALLSRIREKNGITVLLVAHDVNPILPYIDSVIYMARGGAVSGRPEEVITTETLSRLYDTPIEVLHASDGRLVVVGQPEPPAVHSDRHSQ